MRVVARHAHEMITAGLHEMRVLSGGSGEQERVDLRGTAVRAKLRLWRVEAGTCGCGDI